MIDEFDFLFNQCLPAFSNIDIWKRAREIAYGSLTCMGRHTLTGIISASGKQFIDWSAAYRLFSQQRVNTSVLFNLVQSNVLEETRDLPVIIGHMDDTIFKKTGKKIPGTAWRRDPLGPAFQTNFIWGQRFIQTSIALPQSDMHGQSRAIPVDLHHCPTVKKPKKTAEQEDWQTYKEMQKIAKLSKQGSERMSLLRSNLDKTGFSNKQLIMSVDGSYTNSQVIKNLPEKVTLIGRIRKDTKLYCLPDEAVKLGRKKVYGDRLPTPEQIRQSESYQWQEVKAWAAEKSHVFNVKVVENVRWRAAGEKHNLKLVVIRPLGYRLTKSSKILYREPAYLICSDPNLEIGMLLQAYLWRWEIEVNFREEKTIMGCGQAQVRNPNSAQDLPAFITAVYSLLHIASHRAEKSGSNDILPRPKWYKKKAIGRLTTGDLLNNVRAQLWAKAIGLNFSTFVDQELKTRSLRNMSDPFKSAVFYLRN